MAKYANDYFPGSPNAFIKKTMKDDTPYLCMFALKDIPAHTEIVYDYGIKDLPWRKVRSNNFLF